MADAAGLFLILLKNGERAMSRPLLTADDATYLDQVAADVRAALHQPAPDGRMIHDVDDLLAQALAMHARAALADAPRAMALQQVIGVLLPVARKHFGEAQEINRRAGAGP